MIRQLRKHLPLIGLFFITCALLRLSRSNVEENATTSSIKPAEAQRRIVKQDTNQTSKSPSCDIQTIVTSNKLASRAPWIDDSKCSTFEIRHMVPHCREPLALASYPGSGNTWLRYLIEAASGIFTGSRYKDLQLQMYGFLGEIRNWNDGSTIVQKTHDANPGIVQGDFSGRAILLLRNPYTAILSDHNFLYSGHHGRAPPKNYQRKDWAQFVMVQAERWLDMATNWTVHSSPEKVLVIHYENLKSDLSTEMLKILDFLQLPADENRISCLLEHKTGLFRRRTGSEPDLIQFKPDLRRQLDEMVDRTNALLRAKGYQEMPLEKYEYYRKNDSTILHTIRSKHSTLAVQPELGREESHDPNSASVDTSQGAKMVLEQYVKLLNTEDKDRSKLGFDSSASDGAGTKILKAMMKNVNPSSETLEKAGGIFSKAVEFWPLLQRPFKKDPIEEEIEKAPVLRESLRDILP